MKYAVLILVFVLSAQHLFANPLKVLSISSITDESPSTFAMKESQADSQATAVLSYHSAEAIWPWKRRRSCHGGRKQKRRNKKRLKRARA
jgi:hypothetical protein